MRGLILAAGFGTRLAPLTDHLPKALVPVCGKPLLQRSLDFMNSNGIGTIIVNSHYLAKQLFQFKRESHTYFELIYEKDKIRGTGGAIFYARDFLVQAETFCVCNVDIVTNLDLKPIIEEFNRSRAVCGLVCVPSSSKGTIIAEKNSNEYLGRSRDMEAPQGSFTTDFIGIALYKREALRYVEPNDFEVIPVWERIRKHGRSVQIFEAENCYWKDTGTPGELAQIHFDQIDGVIDLPLNDFTKIDEERKIAFNTAIDPSLLENCKNHVWIDSDRITKPINAENSLILKNQVESPSQKIQNTILTPWGEIKF